VLLRRHGLLVGNAQHFGHAHVRRLKQAHLPQRLRQEDS
jgi:hypothetical protein